MSTNADTRRAAMIREQTQEIERLVAQSNSWSDIAHERLQLLDAARAAREVKA